MKKFETRYDWPNLMSEVQAKFLDLRLLWQASEREMSPELHAKMVEDFYLPAVRLLADLRRLRLRALLREEGPVNDRSPKFETQYDKIDWSNLLNEVQAKFNYLRLAWQTSEREAPPALHAKMVEDLYAPCIALLAEFCAAVEVTEEKLDE